MRETTMGLDDKSTLLLSYLRVEEDRTSMLRVFYFRGFLHEGHTPLTPWKVLIPLSRFASRQCTKKTEQKSEIERSGKRKKKREYFGWLVLLELREPRGASLLSAVYSNRVAIRVMLEYIDYWGDQRLGTGWRHCEFKGRIRRWVQTNVTVYKCRAFYYMNF